LSETILPTFSISCFSCFIIHYRHQHIEAKQCACEHSSGRREVPVICWGARLNWLDNNGGAVTENLRGAHHRARVVPSAHDGIRTHSSRMREHQLK
jgi:hypothetical protein